VSDALLTLLRWCLLALVYLFFFRVLQATWFGSTTNVAVRRVNGAATPRRQQAPAAPIEIPRLVIIEPLAMAGQHIDVTGEMTIGRGAGCQITLDDTYMSQRHARVAPGDGGLVVEDLGSTNGTYLNQQLVTAPALGHPGDRIQLGGVIMELR
jgi:hypothetical protein